VVEPEGSALASAPRKPARAAAKTARAAKKTA
jgi:hypothetical protein